MKTKLYVLLVGVCLSTLAFSYDEGFEPNPQDPVMVAYQRCQNSLEGVLAYYMNQPKAVRELAERAIHCKCRQIATAIQARNPSREVADADQPAYQELLSEEEEQACLPPETESSR